MRAMLMPPELAGRGVEPYDVPRGTCPRCGSGDVRHLVIGMPALPESMSATPDWVEWWGACTPGTTASVTPVAWTGRSRTAISRSSRPTARWAGEKPRTGSRGEAGEEGSLLSMLGR